MFNKKHLDPAVTKNTWFSAKKLKFTAVLPAIIPFPACIVYDGFDKEIDAIAVYKRWMNLRLQFEEVGSKLYNQVARSWLKEQLVTPTASEPQTREHLSVFLVQPPTQLHEWKQQKIKEIYQPRADESQALVPAPSAPAQVPASAPSIIGQQPFTMEQLTVASMAAQQAWSHFQRTRTTAKGKETGVAKNKATLGLSKSVFEKLLVMCNLGHGEEDKIPEIWKILAEEGNGGDDKKGKIRRYIEETY